jgi:flagellar hook-associated protein 1 FlgK
LTRSSDGVSWSNANIVTLSTTANQGFTLAVAGAPAAGDKFLIRPTAAAAGNVQVALTESTTSLKLIAVKGAGAAVTDTLNNKNALAMAALQDDATLVGGSNTLSGGYATWVSQIGNLTSNSKINDTVQKNLLDQSKSAQQSVSGVNLDEEAANLLRFQQAYQAAAQIFKTAENMFSTLLTTVGA